MNIEEEIGVGDRLVNPLSVVNPIWEPSMIICDPKGWRSISVRSRLRKSLDIFIRPPRGAANLWIMSCFMVFRVLARRPCRHIIANEMDAGIKVTSGPVIERQGDLAAILTSLQEGDVLFIDEIHRLNHVVEEILYPAMEDFQLDLIIGQGPGARSVKMDLPRFTLVGATTRTGLLTPPLRDRFGVVLRLEFYSPEELVTIVQRSAAILGMRIDRSGALELGRRSRGTPRIANRLLRRVRDFAEVGGPWLLMPRLPMLP